MEIMIRSPKSQDYDSFSNIMDQVQMLHVDWRPDVYKAASPLITREMFEEILKRGNWYVAEVNDIVVGIMGLVDQHIESSSKVTRDILFIDSIAVDKEYRSRGIGHRLLEKAKQIKEDNGYDSIELQVNAKNKPAYEMYKNFGFTEGAINMELK